MARINRLPKNSRVKGKKQCKCLSCEQAWRYKFHDGSIMLVCGDEGCFLNCERCAGGLTCGSRGQAAAVI